MLQNLKELLNAKYLARDRVEWDEILLQLICKIENKRLITVHVLTNQWNSINLWHFFTKLNKTSKLRCQ